MSAIGIQRDMLRGVSGIIEPKLHSKVFDYEPTIFRGSGRRINRFMVGADPEFMFLNAGTEPIHAVSLGLRPALAFGSDQNERLVELRPAASRSTLAVTASILAELRWLYRLVPQSQGLFWRSGAFIHGDGMGGHVHFGRKRNTRVAEVAALDGLAKTIRRTSLLPVAEWTRRCQGDQYNQRYGLYSDIRPQRHGYEYRTLPSWLDSPKLAFLILTLSKLAVVDPDITTGWNEKTEENPWNLLRGLAKFYKGRDDDAWMLFSMMKNPSEWDYKGLDFKARWGLAGAAMSLGNVIYPDCIPATAQDVKDLEAHFLNNEPLTLRESEPHFRTTVPNGYKWLLPSLRCHRRPGVGELTHDWVVHQDLPIDFNFDDGGFNVFFPYNFKGIEEFSVRFPDVHVQRMAGNTGFAIYVGREFRTARKLDYTRSVLLSGFFPIFQVKSVQENDHIAFKETRLKAEKPRVKKSAPSMEGFLDFLYTTSPQVVQPMMPPTTRPAVWGSDPDSDLHFQVESI
jgi:hypothetical protein